MEENVKAKAAPRVKEKRPDGVPKKVNKSPGLMKNDMPPPQPFDENSSIKKLLCEANKIVKMGMEKEFTLLETESTLQNSSETIDNLRKNMLHLQMEYEKLDQNFQREVSYRAEIIRRMDATRELVESVVQCSNVLAASLKQLEDDKLKIAEYYELIYQKQQETEEQHVETEKFIKAQDELLKSKMEEINKFQCKIMAQNSDTISQLNRKLSQANEKLRTTTNENESLQHKLEDLHGTSTKLQTFLEQQERLNSLHQENVVQLKQNIKKLKIHRFKHQKLLKNKKEQLRSVVKDNKNLKKTLKKKELLYRERASTNEDLASKENEWRSKFENHLKEDDAQRQAWEAQKGELMSKLTDKQTEIEDLKAERQNINSSILEMAKNEGTKRKELEQMQYDLSKMLSENLRLKEDVVKMTEENENKTKIITELELKSSAVDADLNSQLGFYKRECEELKDVVKRLEGQLTDMQKRLFYEEAENKQAISDLNSKLEDSLQISYKKTNDLERLLEEKEAYIEKLESENQKALNGKALAEKLDQELQSEKSKNRELTSTVEKLTENYNVVSQQLEEAKRQILDLEEKFTHLNTLNEKLNRAQAELEKNAQDLRKEIQLEEKLFGALEEKYKKAEKELIKLEKMEEENRSLKSTAAELKTLLGATEVRLEAYKAAVQKLENEKIDAKNGYSEEVSRLQLELEASKKEKLLLGGTPPKNVENAQQGKRGPVTPVTNPRGKSSSTRLLNTKENEPEIGDADKWSHISASPIQSGKKFSSTPRKVLTSTPQSGFRTLTPVQKKRDPYEFDSDSSVERFDQDKVLKVFNRQKRETSSKRSKTTK